MLRMPTSLPWPDEALMALACVLSRNANIVATSSVFSRLFFFFFFQAEDGIRDDLVTGVQTCALPISSRMRACGQGRERGCAHSGCHIERWDGGRGKGVCRCGLRGRFDGARGRELREIGRASCRERV